MKVAYHTLGCKVNQYETEAIRERFENLGHETVGENEFADAYIINTCTVTHLADRKSRQYIRRMKRVNPEAIIAVTGCYAQVSTREVLAIPEIDIVTGTNEKHQIPELVEEYRQGRNKVSRVRAYDELSEYIEMGTLSAMEGRTRAYIKIQEGCNRFCSYCVIPYARGKVRSRNASEILKEARALIDRGFKEIVLTGINTALYGTEEGFVLDIDDEYAASLYGIESIIYLLDRMEGEFRIRLSSLEPTVVNSEYVEGLMKYEKLCHHLHLSIQSGSNTVIERMNRQYTREDYLDIVKSLRKTDRHYGITTDIIAGFPGETDEEFEDSIDIIGKAEFLKVHAFQYSKRAGTRAASMKGQVSPEVRKDRSSRLITCGDESSKRFIMDSIGDERIVLFEEFDVNKGLLMGYTDNYIRIYSKGDESLINCFRRVRLDEIYEDGALGILI